MVLTSALDNRSGVGAVSSRIGISRSAIPISRGDNRSGLGGVSSRIGIGRPATPVPQ